MAHNSTNEYLKLLNELQAYHIPKNIVDSLSGYLKAIYRSELENHFSAPMLWIGLYIALASLVCILAMVADVVHGLGSKKLWFPCKYFRINSAFLTVISVAMKLPVDLTGPMPGTVDQVAKLGSMAFMCTMMANLLPCLATMDSNDLLSNIAALCVLVITMVVNVCIQIQTGVVSVLAYNKDPRVTEALVSPRRNVTSLPTSIENYTLLHIIYMTLLLVLLIVHVCSSLALVKSRKIIESKYLQRHINTLNETRQSSGKWLTVEKLQDYVKKHWIMSRSGSPQFIFTTCFPTTSASGVICVFVTILHILTISRTIEAVLVKDYNSDYGWSMIVIVIVQFIGVVIGTILPLSRCFAIFTYFDNVMSFKIILDHIKVFKVESYWTSKLHDWKCVSIRLPYCRHELNVIIMILKRLFLIFCIKSQEGVVVVCKIIALMSSFFMICIFCCWKLFKAVFSCSLRTPMFTLEQSTDQLHPYVLQLNDDQVKLAEKTLEGILKSINKNFQMGEKSQTLILPKLILCKSTRGFVGVQQFDQINHNHDPSLLSKVQHQDSWGLAVVTLTTIAVSLSVDRCEIVSLLRSVKEGLVYVRLVEVSLKVWYDDYISIQKEIEYLLEEVDVYREWLGHKLQDLSSEVKTARQVAEWFRDTAGNIVHEDGSKDIVGGGNDDFIFRSICANSMHRITKTILLTYYDDIDDKELFDSLSSMIADIIAVCLTNLPQVITMKCHTSAIEKREDSIKAAAQLLGETAQIIEILQGHDFPFMNPSDMPFIEKWRSWMESQIP